MFKVPDSQSTLIYERSSTNNIILPVTISKLTPRNQTSIIVLWMDFQIYIFRITTHDPAGEGSIGNTVLDKTMSAAL
jgi:hypothetical protein